MKENITPEEAEKMMRMCEAVAEVKEAERGYQFFLAIVVFCMCLTYFLLWKGVHVQKVFGIASAVLVFGIAIQWLSYWYKKDQTNALIDEVTRILGK